MATARSPPRGRGGVQRGARRAGRAERRSWGDSDDTVGRMAAEGTAEFIDAPYRFVELAGVGHYAPDQTPDQVNALLLEHLAAHPA